MSALAAWKGMVELAATLFCCLSFVHGGVGAGAGFIRSATLGRDCFAGPVVDAADQLIHDQRIVFPEPFLDIERHGIDIEA